MQQLATHNYRVRAFSVISGLIGIWLMVSPHLLGVPAGILLTSATVCGLVALICAIIRFTTRFTTAASWIMLVAGAWLIASPWILGAHTGDRRTWNLVLSGIVLAGMQAYSLTTSAFPRPTTAGSRIR